MKHLDDVEPVYHKLGMRQDLMNSIMVTGPHVSANHLNLLAYGLGQSLQVANHVFFGAISKQVNDLVMLNIREDAAVLMQQIQQQDR